MEKNLINSYNWSYCHYAASNQKAIISFGADPDLSEDTFLYFVTVIDNDNNETFQMQFRDLLPACNYINKRFNKIWNFVDATQKQKSDGGCSTCIAH